MADGIIFRDKKSPKDKLEVTIGDGMEFTIHGKVLHISTVPYSNIISSLPGDSNINLKRGKNNINKSRTIGNSILEHSNFVSNHTDDQISNKSYGSHKHRFKDESHKGSINTLEQDDHEEKRDASKEEMGICDGNFMICFYVIENLLINFCIM